jgi:acyl-coenzyme A thioesterase 9
MFTRGRVRFLSSDGISFAHPVSIGSILLLKSQILHTSLSYGCPLVVSCRAFNAIHYEALLGSQHVGVKANVVDVKTGTEETTNDFRFTWCQVAEPDCSNLRIVVPKSYKGVVGVFRIKTTKISLFI